MKYIPPRVISKMLNKVIQIKKNLQRVPVKSVIFSSDYSSDLIIHICF